MDTQGVLTLNTLFHDDHKQGCFKQLPCLNVLVTALHYYMTTTNRDVLNNYNALMY